MQEKKFHRTKSGCLTCRRRRKKCDGAKPQCQTCIRLKLSCEYKEEHTVWQIQKLEPDGSTVSYVENTSKRSVGSRNRKNSESVNHSIGSARENRQQQLIESNVQDIVSESAQADLLHNDTPAEVSQVMSSPGELEKYSLASPYSSWSSINSMDGTEGYQPGSCEQKKSKDQSAYSIEEQILRVTSPEPHFRFTSEVFLAYDTKVSRCLWGHRFNLPKFVSVEAAETLLSYFCERIAPTFSVFRKHSSSLVTTYLPLASYDPMVLSGLLAWATLHFEKNGNSSFIPLKERLLKNIQRNLVKATSPQTRGAIPVEVTLATLLIMIAIENKGTSSDWVVYYKMAQEAIKGTSQGNRTEDFTWLKNNLLYHEATAPALLMLEDNSEESDSYLTYIDTLDDMPEAYMGICRSIYRINNDIFRLSRKLVNSKSFDVVDEVCREAEVLEQRIEHCQTLEPTEEMVVNGTLVYHQMFFSVLKDTARLYIRQCVHMVASVSTKSMMLVSRIISTIRELFGTVIDSALLFPLFILGVDTVARDARAWVIKAMHDLHKRVGSGNILVAIELLQKIWDRNNEGRIHVLWPQVAMEHGLLVSLA